MSVIKLSDIDATLVSDYHAALMRIRTLEAALRNMVRWCVEEQTIGGAFTAARNQAVFDARAALIRRNTPR